MTRSNTKNHAEHPVDNTDLVPTGDLTAVDPFVANLIDAETERQDRKLIFIASESICPPAVRSALASPLGHIYAEGYPAPRMSELGSEALESFDLPFVEFRRYSDRRYYKGTDYMNLVEAAARRRTAEVFANDRVPADSIFANVQPLSGAAANNAVYQAFLQNGDRILGMSLTSGGHLTHGSPINRSGRSYEVASYTVSRKGTLDYGAIEQQAQEFRPRLIVAGFSAYPWDIDWAALRQVADKVGAILMADISHTAGLVAAGAVMSPVGLADVITFTTHKTLCGPRGAVILTTDPVRAKQIDVAVFPGEQGGPHMHQIAAKAVAMKLAQGPAFKKMMHKVKSNAASMAESFRKRDIPLAYGGTDTHLFLLDLKRVKTRSGFPVTGEIASRVLDLCGITCNKNTIVGDESAAHPSGLRFGTTWVTQRGFGPEELDRVADLVTRVLTNLHAFAYVYAGGEVGRGKLELDLIDEVQAEVERLARDSAAPDRKDWSSPYPHFAPEDDRPKTSPTVLDKLGHDPAAPTTPSAEADGRVLAVLRERQEQEAKLILEGCGVTDLGDAVLLEISGRRAPLFLHSACTADTLTLSAGEGKLCCFLDHRANVLAEGGVLRLEEEPASFTHRFLVRLGPMGNPARTLRWLRALSDGYVFHDTDIFRKAEGPALIRPARGPDGEPLTLVGLFGKKAGQVAAEVLGRDGVPEAGRLKAVNRPDLKGWIFRVAPPEPDGLELFVSARTAPTFWTRLKEAGATPCGRTGLLQARAQLSYPEIPSQPESSKERAESAKAYFAGGAAHRIELRKPYFVGQDALRAILAADEPEPDWKPYVSVEQPEGRKTCLYEEHRKLTAKRNLIPFAGWVMPVWYESIVAEHKAVRQGAGLFDVSHMGVLSVRGRHAERFLDLVTTNYVPWLDPSECQYSYLLDPDGGVIDDIIIYREAADRFMLVVNAANAEKDEAWLRAVNESKASLESESALRMIEEPVEILNLKMDASLGDERRVDIAFQGPASLPVLDRLVADPSERRALARLDRFRLTTCTVGTIDLTVARTGYTGEEIGFELFCHPDRAPELWNTILDAGKALGVGPTGLGARDSTRTEAGFPLHGHELAGPHHVNPLEAGYPSFVRFHKPFFVGRKATLWAYKNWQRIIVRFTSTHVGGRSIRPGAPVIETRRGEYVGTVTSCTTVDRYQVGLALVDRSKVREGDLLRIFPVAEGAPAAEPVDLSRMGPGDRIPLALEVRVLPRFMRPGESRTASAAAGMGG